MDDELYMRQALALACLAEGDTSPNPMVGAVIVSADGEVVGEGYHHKAGQPHAEINALKEAKNTSAQREVFSLDRNRQAFCFDEICNDFRR